jgi:hypothetical protein
MQQDERKRRLKKKKEDDSDCEDSSDDTSPDQNMYIRTDHEEGEELNPDFVKRYTRLISGNVSDMVFRWKLWSVLYSNL